ncbi:thermonuclease family protein [Alysiella crassa]|uniref:Staphylococcal nuclease homologue n=2 Tax=Alysiella crassa TaxID=153491 RepID=A0A376BMI1_9NEIS|nr:thermonuclease family protein [Alysiella crassa]SSY70823.1 Staphylococcal nuclease homologue [Alysiella crassa]
MFLKTKWFVLASVLVSLNACTLPETASRPQLPQTQPTPTTQTNQPSKARATKGEQYTATVLKIADGDTITVQDAHGAQHKIRLAYIDAPETKQNYGMDSQAALRERLERQPVQVQVEDIDRYKREVAIITHNGEDVNYQQIALGNAWHYTEYAKSQVAADFARYQAAMQAAQAKRLGLWQFARPQAPWDYRKQQRNRDKQQAGE